MSFFQFGAPYWNAAKKDCGCGCAGAGDCGDKKTTVAGFISPLDSIGAPLPPDPDRLRRPSLLTGGVILVAAAVGFGAIINRK
jgi:hypothetical protein